MLAEDSLFGTLWVSVMSNHLLTTQVRFFEVSPEELVVQRQAFKDGQLVIKIEDDIFDMAAHNNFVDSIAAETADFQTVQRNAAEKQVWSIFLRLGYCSQGVRLKFWEKYGFGPAVRSKRYIIPASGGRSWSYLCHH